MVSGRTAAAVRGAVEKLSSRHGAEQVAGCACDVAVFEQVRDLWRYAIQRFGRVDIWVNNAGQGNVYKPVWEQAPDHMESIVRANVLGTMYGTTVAYNEMAGQGFGRIYNMEGFGSSGGQRNGLAIYGSTKAGVSYFNRAFIRETAGKQPVQVCTISPGMVITDMITGAYEDPAELQRLRRIFNIIADRVETVAPWLVGRMLANHKHGAHIDWLSNGKVLFRFMMAPFTRRDLFTPLPESTD